MKALTQIRLKLLQRALRSMGTRRRRILAWRSMWLSGVRLVTFERDGIVWNLSAEDDIGFSMFADGGYQVREIRALMRWMQRSGALSGSRDVIVDIGANIGSTCIPFVREAGCRALAIEPVADTFRLLKMNVEANRLNDRILLARKAVLRGPGVVTMCLTQGASGGNFVYRQELAAIAPNAVAGYEEVEADALTAIVDAAGLHAEEIAAVWADVQGCEAEVIESGARLWDRGIPLWAEVEPHSLARQGSLETFAALAAVHFDRFIDSRDLMRLGDQAQPVGICALEQLIRSVTPEQHNTDVLFLPPRFAAPVSPGC